MSPTSLGHHLSTSWQEVKLNVDHAEVRTNKSTALWTNSVNTQFHNILKLSSFVLKKMDTFGSTMSLLSHRQNFNPPLSWTITQWPTLGLSLGLLLSDALHADIVCASKVPLKSPRWLNMWQIFWDLNVKSGLKCFHLRFDLLGRSSIFRKVSLRCNTESVAYLSLYSWIAQQCYFVWCNRPTVPRLESRTCWHHRRFLYVIENIPVK